MSAAMKAGFVRTTAGGLFPCRYSLDFAQDRQAVETFGQTEIVNGLQRVKGRLVCAQLVGDMAEGLPTLVVENGVGFEIDADLNDRGEGTFVSTSEPRAVAGD